MLWTCFWLFSFSFDKHWCEPPLLKYRDRDDADLIMVQLITRHGARTPLHISPAFSNIWRCNYSEYKLFLGSKPMKIHVSYGDSIFLGDCHVGQLIDKGAEDLTRLGEHLNKIYIQQKKFLPSQYNPSIAKFRSTLTHRTLHSTMSFIHGFYPSDPKVVIEVSEKYLDPWRRSSQICPMLKERIEEVRNSAEYKSTFAKNLSTLEEAAKVIGSKTKSAPDIVMAARCNSKNLPSSNSSFSEALFDAAAIVKAHQQRYVFGSPKVFPLMFSFPAGEMTNAMIDRYNGNTSLRFIHWSAHDGNIFGFLGYLGVQFDKLPPYGSYIIVELWKFRRSNDFFIRIIYNGKVMKLPRFGNTKYILFEDFINFVSKNIPDLKNDCKFDLEKFKKASVFNTDE